MIVQVADAEVEKNCPGIMLVVLVSKQSEETLKLLVNFQMMRKSSFIMDYTKTQVTKGGKYLPYCTQKY